MKRITILSLLIGLVAFGPVLASASDEDWETVGLLGGKKCKVVVTPAAERYFEVHGPGVYAPDKPRGLGTIQVNACQGINWRITVVLDPWDGLVHQQDSQYKIEPDRIYFRVFSKAGGSVTQSGYVGGTEALDGYRALDRYGHPVVVSTSNTHPHPPAIDFLIDMETDWTSIVSGTYKGTLVFTVDAL